MNENLLVIDDEVDFLKSVKRALITVGYKKITLVSDPKTVADILEKEPPFDIAVIDITMPEVSGMEVLSLIKRISSSTECLMMTARDETQLAVACLQRGAYDYLVKPMSSDDFLRIVEHGLRKKMPTSCPAAGYRRADRGYQRFPKPFTFSYLNGEKA